MLDRLQQAYEDTCNKETDIKGHLETLSNLSEECHLVVEIGVRNVVSTFALLQGLRKNKGTLISIDISDPDPYRFQLAREAAIEAGLGFQFVKGSDFEVSIPPCDMMFIDSLHTYQQLITELRVFQGRVGKYMVMHDTSPPWGHANEPYDGNYRECPGADRTKQGLWTAVEDFLAECPHWKLKARYEYYHGLTVLEKVALTL